MSTNDQRLKSQLDYFALQGVGILQEPNIVPFLPASRQEAPAAGRDVLVSQDTLFSYLLTSERAIPHLVGFHQDPFSHSAATSTNTTDTTTSSSGTESFPHLPFIITSVSLLAEVRDGIHGFNGTVHGGATCAILDEVMGSLLFRNDILNKQAKAEGFIPPDSKKFTAAATARMDVKYRRPIPTPQVITATATLEKIEGRKVYMHAVVKDKKGQECASCDGVFISFPNGKL